LFILINRKVRNMYQHYKFSLEDSNYNDNIRTNPAHFNSMRAKPTYPQALIEVIPYDKNNYKKLNYYKFLLYI
jgi:hypothetical protein